MNKKKLRASHLRVIEGRGKSGLAKVGNKSSPKLVYLLLLLLVTFLIIQVLTGWVWGTVGQSAYSTILPVESNVDLSFSVSGTITFEEKVVLAPCSGFVYYKVAEGQRVSKDKELAVISAITLGEEAEGENEAVENNEPLQRFKEWFLGEKTVREPGFIPSLPVQGETTVSAPQPGLVSTCFDGLEEFGPQNKFPYFSEENFQNETCTAKQLCQGEKVDRFQPLLKIINNYYWYFSAVFPPGLGELVAEKPAVKLFFSFAPEIPVWGEQVELKEREDGGLLEITWRIDREIPGLYEQRRCEAEIVYKDMPGVLVPKSALVETKGSTGVYILEKGAVRFREIDLLLEKEEDLLIKNWKEEQRIITNPECVKEGQRIKW